MFSAYDMMVINEINKRDPFALSHQERRAIYFYDNDGFDFDEDEEDEE